jgi:hypothetical protein
MFLINYEIELVLVARLIKKEMGLNYTSNVRYKQQSVTS